MCWRTDPYLPHELEFILGERNWYLPYHPSASWMKYINEYLLWREGKRVEGGSRLFAVLWKMRSQSSCGSGREEGKSVKLLLVLSVAIAASQCPRDIWHLVLNRPFFPYIICYKNSWGTRDFDHMTHNTFLPFKQNRTKQRGFKKCVLKATFPLQKRKKFKQKKIQQISTLHPCSLISVLQWPPMTAFANWWINSQIKRFTAELITILRE